MNLSTLIPLDKRLHMIAGAVVALIAWGIFTGIQMEHAIGVAVVVSLVAGCFKELLDLVLNIWSEKHDEPIVHDVDWKDIAFTVLGGVLCMLPFAFYFKSI